MYYLVHHSICSTSFVKGCRVEEDDEAHEADADEDEDDELCPKPPCTVPKLQLLKT